MTEDIKNDQQPKQEKKLFGENLGRYSLVDGNKVFQFSFPIQSLLSENYVAISFLRDEIWKAMESQKKLEDEAKKAKEEVVGEPEVKVEDPIESK